MTIQQTVDTLQVLMGTAIKTGQIVIYLSDEGRIQKWETTAVSRPKHGVDKSQRNA